jgi:MerR family transcriptional regulator, redox-sensitive transcriptional activator SoxR
MTAFDPERDIPERFRWLTVGQLAERTGVATSALRFYEDRGLIHSRRTESGHRRYARGMTRRVAFIMFAQRVGLTLEDIRGELAKLPADRTPSGAEWAALSAMWSEQIDARMAELQRLKRGLTDCIGCGCLSLERCQILNRNDAASSLGSGPRYWLGDEPMEPE